MSEHQKRFHSVRVRSRQSACCTTPPSGGVNSVAVPGAPGSRPAELLQRDARIPDLREMANAPVLEVHHVDIVGMCALAGGRAGTAVPGMRPGEDRVCGDVLALLVDSEGLEVVAGVWKGG